LSVTAGSAEKHEMQSNRKFYENKKLSCRRESTWCSTYWRL